MTERRTLTPQDWIEAAFQALTAQGPRGIRAEALARGLAVSKGSFYWHFKDVAALEAAVLEHWEKAATEPMTAQVETGTQTGAKSAADRLALLVSIATSDRGAAYGGRHVEAALREWARADPRAASALERVEARRLAHLKELLIAAQARQPGRAARLIHAALIGMDALPRHDVEDTRKDMALLLKKLLP